MINWKQKLSSRKLWLGLIIVIVGIVLCCTGDVKNGMVLITTGCCSYLGCEMLVDVFRIVFTSSLFNKSESEDANKDDHETEEGGDSQ